MDLLKRASKGQRNQVQVLEAWADTRPNKVHVSILKSTNVSEGFRDVTHRQIRDAADTFAWWLCNTYGHGQHFPTIAFVGQNDLRYAVVYFGAIKAGYKSLFVSPKNPPAVNASLAEQTQVQHFLYALESTSVIKSIKAHLPGLDIIEMPPFDYWLNSWEKRFPYNKSFEASKEDPVLIMHSSGSTGVPKPVTINNGYWAAADTAMRKLPGRSMSGGAAFDFEGGGSFYSPFPFFHLAGFQSFINQPVMAMEASAILGLPDRPPTPELVLEILRHKKPRGIYSPPSIIESIAQLPGGMDTLASCECIIYAGGPLANWCGDLLTQKVKLSTVYGSTETGGNHMLMPQPEDWDYMEFHPDFHLRMEDAVDGACELVFSQDDPAPELRGATWSHPHVKEYRTKDMFMPHPSKPNLWKFYGRNDDIIVFSNGAKYNPLPAEAVLQESQNVSGALILGDQRTQAAALIEPKAEISSPERFLDELWSDIQRANERSQKQGYLVRTKVALVGPGELIRAPKGTIVRSLTKSKFEDIIEQLYSTEQTTSSESEPMLATAYSLSQAMTDFVRACVHLLPDLSGVSDNDDFYVHGLDSVQTAKLVRTIKRGLKPQYELSNRSEESINASSVHKETLAPRDSDISAEDLIRTTIAKYSYRFRNKAVASSDGPLLDRSTGYHVALTGSTGSLGLYILDALCRDPQISGIACLNRSDIAHSRQLAEDRSIDLAKVEFYHIQLGEPGLGLDAQTYTKLQETLDIIIHNAWKVDFNHTLPSFESVHIRGVANLVDFSIESQRHPRICFVSSVSAVGNMNRANGSESEVRESVIGDTFVAGSTGYGQSKFVAEHILADAARKSAGSVPVTILRVGQIAGSANHSFKIPAWNIIEWFPSLLRTSKNLGMVPNDLLPVDWIPIDVLSVIITDLVKHDMQRQPSVKPQVYNLVNRRKTSWKELSKVVQNRFGCESTTLADWVKRLKEFDSNDEKSLGDYPALKLLPFFERLQQSIERGGGLQLLTENAAESSRAMQELQPVGPELLEYWMDQWGL